MKVTKLDVQSSATPPVPDDSATGQQMMADLLFNSMLQANTDAPMESGDGITIGTENAKMQANGVGQTQDSDAARSVLLAQLNMLSNETNTSADASNIDYSKLLSNAPVSAALQTVQQPQLDQTSSLPPEMAKQMALLDKSNGSDSSATSANKNTQITDTVAENNKNNIKPTDVFMPQQNNNQTIQFSQNIQTNQNNQNDQSGQISQNSTDTMMRQSMDAATTINITVPKETKVANLPNAAPVPTIKTSGKDVGPATIKNTAQPAKKIELPKVDLTPSLPHDATNDIASVDSKKDNSVLAVTQDNSMNNQAMQAIPVKYTDAFTQLSQLINSQTSQYLNNSAQKQTLDLNVNKAVNLTAMNNPQTEMESLVQLSAPMISSFQKDSYDAKIKIYPPELGTVTAKLRVGKNSTELLILTDNSHVKSIVEANLPKLRENFQQADINLTTIQVQTSASNARDQAEQRQNQQDKASSQMRDQEALLSNNNTETAQPATKERNTLIDTYA